MMSEGQTIEYQEWPEDEGLLVQFSLIYQGKLPAESRSASSSSRVQAKHDLRQKFHRQLSILWSENSFLKKYLVNGTADQIATDFTRCGFRFVPLVNHRWALGCSLDITFLRRDNPGGPIESGGDLDNRIKVLFDGLRIPRTCSEVVAQPEQDEDPFFCLLEDDQLITDITVRTDKLLAPSESGEKVHDVVLLIGVTTKVLARIFNLMFDIPTFQRP